MRRDMRRKKTAFIGHPIGGDIAGNVKKVLAICHEVHTREGVIPIAPYLASLQYLDDTVAADRALGMEANHECFYRGLVDELRLYGDGISKGMWGEIAVAREVGIPIRAMTAATAHQLEEWEQYQRAAGR